MTTQPKPNWPDIIALFDDMERSCDAEQPKPAEIGWSWHRERLVLMLQAVMTQQCVALFGGNGEFKRSDHPDLDRIVCGAIAGLIMNTAISIKLGRDGKFETDRESAARLSFQIGREIGERLRSFAQDHGVSAFIETPKGARPSVEPFDFRKHLSGAK